MTTTPSEREARSAAAGDQRRAFRLSPHVRPRAYAVDLSAHPSDPGFQGSVLIDLEAREPQTSITLHARELQLHDASLTPEGGAPQEDLPIRLDAGQQTATITLPRPLHGPARLRLRFSGTLNPSMHGLYLATDGHHRALCTQCQATDARAIFPCFDEPEFKATLQWTLRVPQRDGAADLVALSNGRLTAVELTPEGRRFRFAATPKVASYLAAAAIGPFESPEEREVAGVPLRVYAPRGKGEQTRFALDFTARLLPWYERYFDVPYPYGKYDQVAVPGFDAGAMENVGLVLFRQNLLLMDPATTSWRQEKLIALVVAHEFAHMWFGNLVTMRWWDDLWLNEAFAEWMAHKAVHAQAPDYHVWSDFQSDKNRALVDDAMSTTHPIWTPVETPEEAVELFDLITYQKGCAVMRMLENFLGEEPFCQGLRRYMKAFAEGNATGPDLWNQLSESSGLDVGALMHSWVAQPGFPLVTVELVDEAARAVQVQQRRFFSSPAEAAAPQLDGQQSWQVPLVLRYQDEEGVKEHRVVLREAQARITLPGRGPIAWCYGNAGEIGFYRVQHQGALLARLRAHGKEALTPVEQMGFVEDGWALVRSAQGDVLDFVAALEGMGAARDHNVLRVVTERMGTLDALLKIARDSGQYPGAAAAREGLRAWVRGLLHKDLLALGYEVQAGEEQNQIQRRAILLWAVAGLGRSKETIAEAERYAAREQADARAVDANLAGVFVQVAARFGDTARYQGFVSTYQARKDAGAAPQESARYLHSLAMFRGPEQTQGTLGLIEEERIPQEAVGQVLSQLLGGAHSQEQAWTYLRERWDTLKRRVGDMGLSRLVEAVGALPFGKRGEIVRFFEENPPQAAERALRRALEAMDQREELLRRVAPALIGRFSAR